MLAKIKRAALRFPRDSRGGATSIAAVGATILALGAAALLIDHNQLYGQRDILKSAADAAALAAKLESNDLPAGLSEAEVVERVAPRARQYAVLNVLANITSADIVADDVNVTFEFDDDTQVLSATVQADTGETIMSNWLYGYLGPGAISARSGVDTLYTAVELVLAIDLSVSMNYDLAGVLVGHADPTSRISIVKAAAAELVQTLQVGGGTTVAVGIIPWDLAVRLSATAAATWTTNGWAEFPGSRHYAVPYECAEGSVCSDTAHDSDMPDTAPEPWEGCLDEHRVTSGHADIVPAAEWFDHPGTKAFAQMFYPARFARTLQCMRRPVPAGFGAQSCHGANLDRLPNITDREPAQQRCHQKELMLPLTTDQSAILDQIDELRPRGGGTNSWLGLLWAQRLLTPAWRDVWGDSTHPVDGAPDVRKAIVLLTDGEDSHCGPDDPHCEDSNLGYPRSAACTAIKAAETEIFVVTAIAAGETLEAIADPLRTCSSQGDRPGTYVFLNNDDPTALRNAFRRIAIQLRSVRRIY